MMKSIIFHLKMKNYTVIWPKGQNSTYAALRAAKLRLSDAK